MLELRKVVADVLRGYERNDLLTYASAISFQIMFAILPLALFGLGMLGALGLEEVYRDDVVPEFRDGVSPALFTVIDDTVQRVFDSKQVFWITFGAAFTVWEMSGATRAIMDVFDRIYDNEERRPKLHRYRVSILLAIVTGGTILLTIVLFQAGGVAGGLLGIARWPVAIVLLLVTMALFVRFAPSRKRPWGWVSVGSLLTVVAWIGASVVFGLYVTHVADYGSLFGNLATIIIAFEYLYLATCAFLTGAQLDAVLRDRASDEQAGAGP